MPVDTSLYQNLKTPDPTQNIGQLLQMQNVSNQNRLFQQQYGSNVALSQAVKNSIDPQSGSFDINKFTSEVGSGPAAYQLPQMMTQIYQMGKERAGSAQAQLGLVTQGLAPLVANFQGDPSKLTLKDVFKAGGDIVAAGGMSPQEMLSHLQRLPQKDGVELYKGVRDAYVQGLDHQSMISQVWGAPAPVDTGNQVVMQSTSPLGGTRIQGVFNKGLSPEAASEKVDVYDPQTRQMRSITRGQFADMAAGGAPQGGAPDLGNGRYQGGAPAAPGGAPQPQPMGIPAGPPLGAGPAADVMGQESAKQGVALQQTADQVPQRKALLQNLESSLEKFTSGPGSDWKRIAKSMLNVNNPLGDSFDVKSIASQEEFNKLSTQFAQAQAATLGTGTDAKLDSAMHTSPNSSLTPAGNKSIIAILKGNEDAISAKNQAWQKWLASGNGPESYGQFSATFNKGFNPRVFQFQYMDKTDAKAAIKAMKPDEKKSFVSTLRMALDNGWLTLPGASNGR